MPPALSSRLFRVRENEKPLPRDAVGSKIYLEYINAERNMI